MKKMIRVMGISFGVNALLSIGKIITGFIGSSSALITDGIHSFSDLTTDVVAILGIGFSHKKPDKKHPYGHGRAEYITSLLIGLMIIFLGFGMIYEMMNRDIRHPNILVSIFVLITIVVKYVLSKYVLKEGLRHNNNTLIASAKESSSDVYSSIIVLISIIASQFYEVIPALIYTDKVTSVVIAIYILRIGFDVIKENFSHLLGEKVTDTDYLNKLDEIIKSSKEITGVSETTVLKYGHTNSLVCVILMDDNLTLLEAHKIVDKIEKKLKKFDKKLAYITIHMEPNLKK